MNANELDSLDGKRVTCFVPLSLSSSNIKLRFIFFWMSLLIMFFVHFIATASNTVLEGKKKTLSRNNSNVLFCLVRFFKFKKS